MKTTKKKVLEPKTTVARSKKVVLYELTSKTPENVRYQKLACIDALKSRPMTLAQWADTVELLLNTEYERYMQSKKPCVQSGMKVLQWYKPQLIADGYVGLIYIVEKV
jgi:hypothetical protein